VLNDDGDYVGFDAVIGNPPYIGEKGHKEILKMLRMWIWVSFMLAKWIISIFLSLGS